MTMPPPTSSVANLCSTLVSESNFQFGMEVNADKIKIFAQPAPGQKVPEIIINIGDLPLGVVNNFQYLANSLFTTQIIQKRHHPLHTIHSLGLWKAQKVCIQQPGTLHPNKTQWFTPLSSPPFSVYETYIDLKSKPNSSRSSISNGRINTPTTKFSIIQKCQSLKPPFSSIASGGHSNDPFKDYPLR